MVVHVGGPMGGSASSRAECEAVLGTRWRSGHGRIIRPDDDRIPRAAFVPQAQREAMRLVLGHVHSNPGKPMVVLVGATLQDGLETEAVTEGWMVDPVKVIVGQQVTD
jgi:hypothetical protein